MSQKRKISRRRFLAKAGHMVVGAIGFPYIIPSSALGKAGSVAPSNRINLGFIGVGGRGNSLVTNFLGLSDAQVVAVCDVKKPNRQNAQLRVDEYYGKKVCRAYNDFREICSRNDIDAVVIASTDQWHILHSLYAVRAGKDVYCEKPLGVSLEESKVLRDKVHRTGCIFQFGTQERSSAKTRFGCELVLNGRIGKLKKIKVGSRHSDSSPNFPPQPIPDWLDYQMWLGPAPWAPYDGKRTISSYWFHIRDYAVGFIAGCGVHTVDMAAMGSGTDLTGPVEVKGSGVIPKDGLCNCLTSWNVDLVYENGLIINFTDEKQNKPGTLFEGTQGRVHILEEHLSGTVDTYPKSLLQEVIGPDEIKLPVSNHHQQNFLDCIKTRTKPVAPIDIAVRSDTLCIISDIAARLERKLKWDPNEEQFIDDNQANRMLKRSMRSPWHL